MRPVYLLLFALLFSLSAAAERYALIIGNANYENATDLAQTANDARAMATKLRELGFTLIGDRAHVDLSRAEMIRQIRTFGRSVQPDDDAVFYFSGHGIGGAQTNYLLPSDDGYIEVKEDVDDFAVDVAKILERLPSQGTGTNVIVLDACRNNPLPSLAKSAFIEKGLTRVSSNLANTVFLYAAEPGKRAYVGTNGNSYFTDALLNTIDDPALDLTDLARQLRSDVFAQTSALPEPQRPWKEGIAAKPFFFALSGSARNETPIARANMPGVTFETIEPIATEDIAADLPPPPTANLGITDPQGLLAIQNCEAGDLTSCSNVGMALYMGHGAPLDATAGAALYRYACQNGGIPACSYLGAAHRSGTGVNVDFSEARRLFSSSCAKGFPAACTGLGELFMVGLGVAQDYKKGIGYYQRGCDGGDSYGCYLIAFAYATGVGISLDLNEARGRFQTLCDASFTLACNDVGMFDESGTAGPINLQSAELNFEKACDDNVAHACMNQAALYARGRVAAPGPNSVKALLLKTCSMSAPDYCAAIGNQVAAGGNGIAADVPIARELLRAACARGSESGCQSLSFLP